MMKHTKSIKIIGRRLGRPTVEHGKGRTKISRGIQSGWIDLVFYKQPMKRILVRQV